MIDSANQIRRDFIYYRQLWYTFVKDNTKCMIIADVYVNSYFYEHTFKQNKTILS